MKLYRADLHIHSVLSPCGDLEMSPKNIVEEAVAKRIDIIGITDHNTTRHCRVVSEIAERAGIFTLKGAEITTAEEVHCLAFFERFETLDQFQKLIDEKLPDFPNNPAIFGDQLVVDEEENILYSEPRLLHNALDITLEELSETVAGLGGIFIPAHIDRSKNSIYSQLGLFPAGLKADALEVSWRMKPSDFTGIHPEVSDFTLVTSSDAHFRKDMGRACTVFKIQKPGFTEIKLALAAMEGRYAKAE